MSGWAWEQWKGLIEPGQLDRQTSYKGLASYTMALPGHEGERSIMTSGQIDPTSDYELSFVLRGKNLPKDSIRISLLQWGTRKGKKVSPQGWAFHPARKGVETLFRTGGTFEWMEFKVHVYKESLLPSTKKLMLFIKNKGVGVGELGIDEVRLIAVDPIEYKKPETKKAKLSSKTPRSKKKKQVSDERRLSVKPSPGIESSHLKIFTDQPANLFEGNQADLFFSLKMLPTQFKTVDLVVTDYFGNTVYTQSRDVKELSARNKISLSNLKGWFKLTLDAKNKTGHTVETLSASFVVLEKMSADYYEPDNASMFGGWGQYAKYMRPEVLGFKWQRSWYFWKWLQPREKSTIPTPHYPKAGSQAYLMGLGHSSVPDWAAADPKKKIGILKELDPFLNFVRTIVTAKKKMVSAWEIWNEPYFGTSMWPGDHKSYFEVHKATYQAIKEIDPDKPVIGPTLNPFKHMGDIKKLFELGLLDYCDGISIHPYIQNESPETSGFRVMLQNLKKLMRDHGGEKPIWNTEYGWRGDAESPIGGPENQARYVVRSYLIQLAENVRAVTYWTVWNSKKDTTPVGKWRNAFVFFDAYTATPRPSAAAYGVMTRMMYKSKFIRDLTGFNDTTYALLFEGKKNPRILTIWDHWRERNILLYTKNKITVVDMMGNRHTIEPKNGLVHLRIGNDPVYVLGMTDADLVMNDTLMGDQQMMAATSFGDKQGIPLAMRIEALPTDIKQVVLHYLDGDQIRQDSSSLIKTKKHGLARFSGNFSEAEPPGLTRVFVENASGEPLGFCVVNLKQKINITGYELLREGLARRVRLNYRVAGSKSVPGLVVFKDKNGQSDISVRFDHTKQTLDLDLPETVKTGGAYDLKILYNASGDAIEAFQSSFYYVPATKVQQAVTVDGKLNDWKNAQFIDFRAAPWFSTRGGNLDAYDMQCSFALQWDKDKLYLCVRVENDDFYQKKNLTNAHLAWEEDSIQVGLDPYLQDRRTLRPSGELRYVKDEWPYYEYTFAKVVGLDTVVVDFSPIPERLPKHAINPKGVKTAITVDASRKTVVYEMSFDRSVLMPAPLKMGTLFGFSVVCNDRDVDPSSQSGSTSRLAMEWSSGIANGKVYQKFGSFFLAP